MFIYPITIVLIVLNVIPNRFASPLVFRAVIIVTILFSIPDFLKSIGLNPMAWTFDWIPLQPYSLGWVLPASLIFILVNLSRKN